VKLEVGDIKRSDHRLHIRQSKGNKDRYMPLPDALLERLEVFWLKLQFLFIEARGAEAGFQSVGSIDHSGIGVPLAAQDSIPCSITADLN